jgi:hypothetical protein
MVTLVAVDSGFDQLPACIGHGGHRDHCGQGRQLREVSDDRATARAAAAAT